MVMFLIFFVLSPGFLFSNQVYIELKLFLNHFFMCFLLSVHH